MRKLIIFFIFSLILVPTVLADGMVIIPWEHDWKPLEENNQIAAINYENGLEKMIITINFNTENQSEAVWVFPVPSDPNKVVIDVITAFPNFYGYDPVSMARNDIDDVIDATRLTQIYPIFFQTYRGVVYGPMLAGVQEAGIAKAPADVTVYEHLEKEGITTEILTARTGEALYRYLSTRGFKLQVGSIHVLDDYVGKDYTFVVSWVTYPPLVFGQIPRYRQPAIFITFPTDEVYFPLMPTSVYGSKTIPITIYLLDYYRPRLYSSIKSYTTTNYYVQSYFGYYGGYDRYGGNPMDNSDFKEFFGNTKTSDRGYTRVDINVPSKYLSDDLWFEPGAPAKVSYAVAVHSFISENKIAMAIAMILILSALSGAIAGLIVFRDIKKWAIVGLTNVFSIIGVIIALAFTKTRKFDESFTRRLRQEGAIIITGDRRKIIFVVLFSILFLLLGWVAGYWMKLPLA